MRIELPWPPSALSPNSRTHWRAKARVAQKYRRDCYALTCGSMRGKGGIPAVPTRIPVSIVFHPADARRRDLDNCLARLKSGLDGIADALMVDDSRFDLTLQMGHTAMGGKVVVEV